MNQFQINTEIVFGENALDRLSEIQGQRVLIVCDAFIEKSGMIALATDRLSTCDISVFSEVVPDPSLELIARGVEVLRSFDPTVVIALGGGSAIDAAKAMYEFALQINNGELGIKSFIAMPTTSGTGSEVTSFAVVTDTDNQVKIPLVDDDMMPNVAILAPELTVSVPPAITADTGMDVITHAIEALASNNATDFTDALAEKALCLAFEYLPQAYENGKNVVAREKMHNASCLAGVAFNQAGLGINHGLAHAIGGKWHLAHGRTNAILLPQVIEFNAQITGFGEQEYSHAALCYQRMAKILGLVTHDNVPLAVNSLIKAVRKLQECFGIPQTLVKAGIAPEELTQGAEGIVGAALEDVCTKTNPRSVDSASLKELFLALSGIKDA